MYLCFLMNFCKVRWKIEGLLVWNILQIAIIVQLHCYFIVYKFSGPSELFLMNFVGVYPTLFPIVKKLTNNCMLCYKKYCKLGMLCMTLEFGFIEILSLNLYSFVHHNYYYHIQVLPYIFMPKSITTLQLTAVVLQTGSSIKSMPCNYISVYL